MKAKEKITIFDMQNQSVVWKKSHVINVEDVGSNPITLTSVHNLLIKIVDVIHVIQGRLDNIEHRLDNVEHRLDNIEQRLDNVEHRLDNVEHRLDNVEQRLDNVEHRLDNVEHRLDGLDHRLDNIVKLNNLKE